MDETGEVNRGQRIYRHVDHREDYAFSTTSIAKGMTYKFRSGVVPSTRD